MLQKAPAAKKSIEKFIYAIKYLFNEAGAADAFWMGNLKHKDLAGHTVASQVGVQGPTDTLCRSGAVATTTLMRMFRCFHGRCNIAHPEHAS